MQQGLTPLMVAINAKNLEMVSLLLQRKAEVDVTNEVKPV